DEDAGAVGDRDGPAAVGADEVTLDEVARGAAAGDLDAVAAVAADDVAGGVGGNADHLADAAGDVRDEHVAVWPDHRLAGGGQRAAAVGGRLSARRRIDPDDVAGDHQRGVRQVRYQKAAIQVPRQKGRVAQQTARGDNGP